ncbi:hypothetical protein EIP91_001755 [Steccherinum ochraceum]|uniref:Uncharacterized protein n=1 Tax=Steccherinum ochraceum TaxID=92696 RepID=A0A4R0RH35_9APHY|nr:hypothetical protein EIP91_001755 [Steccherinum ochraceum]
MFMHLFTAFFPLVALLATLVGAAPTIHFARQSVAEAIAGNSSSSSNVTAPSNVTPTSDDTALLCNTARFQVVGSVLQAAQTARNLTAELASDSTGSALIANVTQSLISSQDALATIATAVFNNDSVSSNITDTFGSSLSLAFDVASNITSNDTAVIANLAQLKDEILFAGTASNQVVQNCN